MVTARSLGSPASLLETDSMTRSLHRKLRITVFAVLSGLLLTTAADARTISGAAGMAGAVNSANEFAWLTTGVVAPNATPAAPKSFVVPIVLDTAGVKSFIVRGVPTGLSCTIDQRGTVSQSIAIPVSRVGAVPTVVNMTVTAGNTVVVRCTFTSNSGRLLLVDHN
jgi:hypothetical protein